MRRLLAHLCAGAVLVVVTAAFAAPAAAQPLPGTTCALLPGDNVLNTDVSSLPVNAQSITWKTNMAQNANLHPDFGTVAQQYGIPVNVAPPPSTGLFPTFAFDSESDHPTEGYPIDQSTLIEGGPSASSGSDRHALVENENNCKLYELYNLQNFTNGRQPQAGSGAVWDLSSNAMRPNGWTSADAAGLPITPLLLRPDEILAGSIAHAIRFTTHCTHSYIWPASHDAGLCGTSFPPMGARFRLRSSFNIGSFSATTQVVLRAFQHYGLVLADNGADWYFQGTTDEWWGTTAGSQVVSELKTIPAAQFNAVDESSLQVAAGSYRATPPTSCATASLSANPPSPGGPGATVTWTGGSTGCPNPRYRFWELDPGSRWSMVQEYSAATTYTWHSPAAGGSYRFEVDVRDASEAIAYDAVAGSIYTINGGATCTTGGLSASPRSPGATGVAVTLTGSSASCPNPRYRFWIKDPGSRWSMVQDYSAATTHLWAQTGLAGPYSLEVDVRDASESVAYDLVANITYSVDGCSAAGLAASPTSPQTHGTTITLTGTSTCPGTTTYRFWVRAPGGTWKVVQNYTTANTFSWTPPTAGNYSLEVDVRDQNASASYERVANATFAVT